MSSGTPVTYKKFLTSNLKLSQIKTTPRGAKVVWVNYNEGPISGSLYLQTPFGLRAPMGITKWENEGQNPSYELLLSLNGEEGKEFADKLSEFDEFVKNEALSKSKEWFKKNIDNMVVVETLYNPTLRLPRDKDTGEVTDKYPPSFRAKIPMSSEGKPECEVYEIVNGKPISVDLEDLMERKSLKGASVTAIVKCSGIWFPQKFSASWQVQQLLIETNSGMLKPCAFVGMSTPVANINSPDEGDEGYFNNYQDVESVEDNIE
jgi:hypothetical protein